MKWKSHTQASPQRTSKQMKVQSILNRKNLFFAHLELGMHCCQNLEKTICAANGRVTSTDFLQSSSVTAMKILHIVMLWGFLGGSVSKESVSNAADLGLILGLGRSLEKEMATHSSILAWRIPWTEEPGGLQFKGWQELDMTEPLNHHLMLFHSYSTYRFLSELTTWWTYAPEHSPLLFIMLKMQKLDVPGGSVVKNLPANTGNTGSIPGMGRSHVLWSN